MNDLDFMKTKVGIICLIKQSPKMHGFLLPDSWTVHTGYVWDGGDGGEIQYDSPEEILADGWTID